MDNMQYAMGWLKDMPDFRDFTPETDRVSSHLQAEGKADTVKEMLATANVKPAKAPKLPAKADLRAWCSPIEHQKSIGSCTAHAGVGLIEYFERRVFGKHMDASRLFLYKVTRNLLKWTGDTGAYLRSTMGAMAMFGVAPENYYPYVISRYDEEPSPFVYAMAQNFKAITFYRLDAVGTSKAQVLTNLKTQLAAGLPAMFGFTCYTSLYHTNTPKTGEIPFPEKTESVTGGHAVMAVGYDDAKVIAHPLAPRQKTKGAILIRNSWGQEWGEQGYGWLPYEYLSGGIAEDFWCLIKKEYMETGQFNK